MKPITTIFFAALLIVGCKHEPKTIDYSEEPLDITTSVYPETISKIFDAHGGIDQWNSMQGLYFEIPREDFVEKQNLNLKNRKSRIDYKHHVLGFDGENVWLKNLDTVTYKSNPRFYYNLMSYFYAMPFILGDDGINYEERPNLEVDGKTYPGMLISYEAGIGESPEDEYIIYYDPETFEMKWLAYTVTFFTKEKAKKFSLIKYAEWEDVDGLKLPKTLQWHHYQDGVVGDRRNELNFTNSKLSMIAPDDRIFEVAEGAVIAQ